MANGINKVTLIGRLGADPELKYTASGTAVASVSLATSETWKDKATGEKQESTEWHRLVFWNRLAEIAGEYPKKGDLLYVDGKLSTRKWQDSNGNDRWTTEIVVQNMQMLSNKNSGGSDRPPAPPPPGNGNGAVSGAAVHAHKELYGQSAAQPGGGGFDDDIPF